MNDESVFGETLYHYAADNNRPHILQYLLHVDKKHIDKGGFMNMTPLHYASYMGYIDCVQVLLSHGADPEMKDKFGRTPYGQVCEDTDDISNKEEIRNMMKKYMNKI